MSRMSWHIWVNLSCQLFSRDSRLATRTEPEFLREEHSPKWVTTGKHTKWGRGREGNILGQDWIGVGRSCVRMGSDKGVLKCNNCNHHDRHRSPSERGRRVMWVHLPNLGRYSLMLEAGCTTLYLNNNWTLVTFLTWEGRFLYSKQILLIFGP